jgi:hypothetical protein
MELVPSSSVPSSQRLVAAAEAERQRLERELRRSLARAAAAADELQKAVETGSEVRQRLALLDQLGLSSGSGETPQPIPSERVEGATVVKGAQIRKLAVRLLAGSAAPEQPIHYAEWFKRFSEAGYSIAARDPLANFLTQVSRSPVVRRASDSGTYALDLEAPIDLRKDLYALHEELARLHSGQQTIDGIISLRERRNELLVAIARVERELQEATESLGADLAA